jgi:glutamyl-tRNA reductase
MGVSKNRKNHKQKVNARKDVQKQVKNIQNKMMQNFIKQMTEQQKKKEEELLKSNPDNVDSKIVDAEIIEETKNEDTIN